jgi:hypothetical protein
MKKSVLPVIVFLVLFMSGCSMKSNLYHSNDTTFLPADAKFQVGETIDVSGYVFPDQSEKFSLNDAMTGSLNSALSIDGLASDQAKYVIKTKITSYAPGNAFTRWLIPGAGATKLSTESVILTKDNVEIARIPVERSIAAGGGYTINAWKYVFDEVAKETSRVIKAQLLAPKNLPTHS